jgi:hypothetical protein
MKLRFDLYPVFVVALGVWSGFEPKAAAITHSFLATGAETYIRSGDGRVIWRYPGSTRDGWVLPGGHLLLAVSKCEEYPGGAALELTRDSQKIFEFKGRQAEVNTAEALPNGNIMLTEAGDKPCILEVNRQGTIMVEVPLSCQTTNHHMETRMTRKLPNGNYLVPQLLDKVVREYTPAGKIVWEVKTPHWPFTAIRLANGHTLIDCTRGNLAIEVDAQGKTVWELNNHDFPRPLLNDACGAQRLPNGNTVVTSYGIGAEQTKLLEVTPDKQVVWVFSDPGKNGIHHFQILDTNEQPLAGTPLR